MELLNGAVGLLLMLIELVAVPAVLVAGLARLRGRRSRLDRVASLTASAFAMSIYPPSLRGGGVVVPPRPAMQVHGTPRRA